MFDNLSVENIKRKIRDGEIEHSHQFPKLATIAHQVFAIPASSAASERSFSAAGFTVSERRSALSPDTVDDILFVHSNNK